MRAHTERPNVSCDHTIAASTATLVATEPVTGRRTDTDNVTQHPSTSRLQNRVNSQQPPNTSRSGRNV